MATTIQETPRLENDTDAYELSLFSTVTGAREFLNDPDTQIQFLEPGETVRAYVHNRGGGMVCHFRLMTTPLWHITWFKEESISLK